MLDAAKARVVKVALAGVRDNREAVMVPLLPKTALAKNEKVRWYSESATGVTGVEGKPTPVILKSSGAT